MQSQEDEMGPWLIAGLGNPGRKYAGTRHNIGFEALDRLADRYRLSLSREKFQGHVVKGRLGTQEAVLLKPMTYMNKSGQSVSAAQNFYDIALEKVIVFHDEIDLAPGALRLKFGGGHGGHNGLRDIVKHCGGRDFYRVRMGVGRPEHGNVTGHVLGRFESHERSDIDALIEDAADAAEILMEEGLGPAQNRFH